MPDNFLNCPQCQRQLRVPEALQGRPVKCPACGIALTIPSASPEVNPPPVVDQFPEVQSVRSETGSEPLPEREYSVGYPERRVRYREPGPSEPERRRKARVLVSPPAIVLMALATIGLVGDIFEVVVLSLSPEAVINQFRAMQFNAPVPEETIIHLTIVIHAASAVLCLVILAAAIQMLRQRMYPFAIVGCVLACINIGCYCCIPGAPVGVWGLIVLMLSDVREYYGK